MSFSFDFHPEAEEEFVAAIDWYEERIVANKNRGCSPLDPGFLALCRREGVRAFVFKEDETLESRSFSNIEMSMPEDPFCLC